MEQKKKRGGLIHYPVLILFSVFFVGVFVLDLLTPDRQVSELENTTLTQRPASFSATTPSTPRTRFPAVTAGSASRALWRRLCSKRPRAAAFCWGTRAR